MILSLLTLPVRLPLFALWFAKEVVVSSLAVVKDAVTPGIDSTPRLVRMPMRDAGDLHVTMISVLITLTPGTLTLGAAHDGKGERDLLVHSMYHADNDSALVDLHDMDDRMVRAARIGGGS